MILFSRCVSILEIKIIETSEFSKTFTKLYKKYPHLKEDFGRFKRAVLAEFDDANQFAVHICVPISNLGHKIKALICKGKKFHSSDFAGRGSQSGFRLIYAYEKEKQQITFIEIYHKNKQENESKELIHKYFDTNQ